MGCVRKRGRSWNANVRNYLLKSLRVAIATNQKSLNLPHKELFFRNW